MKSFPKPGGSCYSAIAALIEERNELSQRNAELLEACKRVLVHGANEYAAEDILREVIAKNEQLP